MAEVYDTPVAIVEWEEYLREIGLETDAAVDVMDSEEEDLYGVPPAEVLSVQTQLTLKT